jgi:hypothetical protein
LATPAIIIAGSVDAFRHRPKLKQLFASRLEKLRPCRAVQPPQKRYLELCRKNGWEPKIPANDVTNCPPQGIGRLAVEGAVQHRGKPDAGPAQLSARAT